MQTPGAPNSPELSALLARTWSKSRQLFVILWVTHRPSIPSLPPPSMGERKGRTNHLRSSSLSKFYPLSGILQGGRGLGEQLLSSCVGTDFQGSGPCAPIQLLLACRLPLPPPPSKLISVTNSILAGDKAPHIVINYIASPDEGPLVQKEDTILFILHLHSCILNSIFKSDNKSMAPRRGGALSCWAPQRTPHLASCSHFSVSGSGRERLNNDITEIKWD
jgi:hypothetical protein